MLPNIALFSEVLPIIFYLIFLKRNRGQGLWVIFLYCILSFLIEPFYHMLGTSIPQYYVYSSFTIIEFTLFSLFFYSSLTEKKFKYIPLICAVVFYVVAIVNFKNKSENPFDSLPASVEAILVISYCILLLYEQMKDPSVGLVYNSKKFWVIIAFLIYFAATLFLFIYTGALSEEQRSSYWPINNFFEILKNILFCVSFIMKKRYNNPYAVDSFEP